MNTTVPLSSASQTYPASILEDRFPGSIEAFRIRHYLDLWLDKETPSYGPERWGYSRAVYWIQQFISMQSVFSRGELRINHSGLKAVPPILAHPIFCGRIETLDLSGNCLEHVPEEVLKLSSLRNLDVSNNFLTKLPSTLNNLSRLIRLNISHNPLKTLPYELISLPPICVIQANDAIPHCFQTTLCHFMCTKAYTGPRVEGIFPSPDAPSPLSEEQISDAWTSTLALFKWKQKPMYRDMEQAFARMLAFIQDPEAASLDLTGVCFCFSDIPPLFQKPFISRLKVLKLSDNCWSWNGDELKKFSALEELYLDDCREGHLYRSLETLSKLRILHLNNNQFRDWDVFTHSNYNCQVSRFTFQNLTNLEELDLSENSFKEIPQSMGHLTNLKTLYLGRNYLSQLPQEITQLTNLQHLDLSHNNPEFYDSFPPFLSSWVGNLQHLRLLDLSHPWYFWHLSTSLFELPASCTVHLNFPAIPSFVYDALARVCFSEGYQGPSFEGLTAVLSPYNSLSEAHDALQATLDIERWRRSIGCWHSYPKHNQACDQIERFITDPSQTSLDLNNLLWDNGISRGPKSLPPIFQEPFISRLEILLLTNDDLTEIPEEIMKLKALKKLDIRSNRTVRISDSLKAWMESRLEEFLVDAFTWNSKATVSKLRKHSQI